jgi:hypothetical protein
VLPTPRPTVLAHGNLMVHLKPGQICEKAECSGQ